MHRLFRLLLQALCALVALVAFESRAHAAAPMCGEEAVSVEAPPPIYPSKNGVIEACDSPFEFTHGVLPSEHQEHSLLKGPAFLAFLIPSELRIARANYVPAERLLPERIEAQEYTRAQLRPPRRS